MFAPDPTIENAFKFSRIDPESLLSTVSAHPIELEGHRWLSCEHYYQLKILSSEKLKERVRAMDDPIRAFKLGKPWYRGRIKDWKNKRRLFMTRALYTKVQMYDDVRDALMSIDQTKIIESSLYDHYWGLGRDQRGENVMGEIWMDIRQRVAKAR